MKSLSTFNALIDRANASGLYQKLVRQLKKDFALSNIDTDIQDNISPENLKNTLHETIYNLIQNSFDQYLNLLYIVDIPEEKIKQLDGSDDLKLSESVAFLVLKREWQKVWYKNNF